MHEDEIRKIRSRLRRLAGQVKALEAMVGSDEETIKVVTQMKAAIAASKGCLNEYGQHALVRATDDKERQALLKLLLIN